MNKRINSNEQYEKSQAEKPDLVSSVFVPLLQSIITSLLCGSVGASLAYCFNWPVLKVFSVTTSVLAAGVWIILLWDSRQILWSVEKLIGRDFNRDGKVGRPPPINVEVITQSEEGKIKNIKYSQVPIGITPTDLVNICDIVLTQGKAFSRSNLNFISANNYSKLIKYLMSAGMMVYKNGKNKANGVELTAAGRAFFRSSGQ